MVSHVILIKRTLPPGQRLSPPLLEPLILNARRRKGKEAGKSKKGEKGKKGKKGKTRKNARFLHHSHLSYPSHPSNLPRTSLARLPIPLIMLASTTNQEQCMRNGRATGTMGFTLFAAMFMTGCASSHAPKQASAPPAYTTLSDSDYAALKARYLAANPDARLGRVAAVLPDQKRLAVADLPSADFHKGDVLSVVDGDLNLLADGSVVEIDPDLIYVTYEPATVGSRSPVVGDIAIRPK